MFQFLNLDNASKAEKEILHTILFKDGHHQRKEFFKDLRPEYEAALDVGNRSEAHDTFGFGYGGPPLQQQSVNSHHRDRDRDRDIAHSDTSSTAGDITEGGMANDMSSNSSMRSQQGGMPQMRGYYTSAPIPPNTHPGGPTHPLGHHPQMPMYHPQMMQTPTGQYMPPPYPVMPVSYGPPAPHNIGLPTHLPPQPYMSADVPDIHMHQKLHDMHHSPGAGGPHSSKYVRNPKTNRPRRNEETYHAHPQFYQNMGYPAPMYYTTQSVTNMTGTPLIMPGSGAPGPMYHQGPYPPMYPPMMGNDQQIHHPPQPHGVPNMTQRTESPKSDTNTYSSATNGDPIGLSPNCPTDNEQQQRTDNEETEERSSSSQSQSRIDLKVNVQSEGLQTVSAPPANKSPRPQSSELKTSSETPAPPSDDGRSPVPESRLSDTVNGGDQCVSPTNTEQQKTQLPQPESKPKEDTANANVANIPSKPAVKTWSSTVNGGAPPTAPPVQQQPPSASTSQAKKEREAKDSAAAADFPHLSATTATSTSTTSSTSQAGRMSWASVASRQTVGGVPVNGISSTINHEHAGAKRVTGESLSHFDNINTKHALENDSSVGLYTSSSAQEPVYDNDPIALKLGEYLANYVLDHHTFSLTPRGLSNQNNFCYINATLQALVACPPFVNLFRSLYDIIGKKPCKSTPIIQSMFDFIMEFEPITRLTQQRNRKTSDAFYVGANFEASGIRKVLGLLDGATFKVEGRQQDAEEFLSHLLNALHDEMIKVIKWSETKKEGKSTQSKPGQSSSNEAAALPPQTAVDEDDDSEQWQVMGPKNKGCMTRKTSLSKSPISEMFVGQMCSALNRANSLKSTTLQPFFTLQLDIQSENIHTIRDALDGISIKEEVTGCVTSNGLETEAWKQMSLEVLPAILILHMKRFVFDTSVNTIRKLDKRVDFAIDLEIPKDLLSLNSRSKYLPKQRLYKLFAVVYHDGEEAIKGHYIADTFHPSGGSLWGQFGWIRYDDTAVKGVGEGQILNPHAPRVPYLLYYRRVDTLQTKKDRL